MPRRRRSARSSPLRRLLTPRAIVKLVLAPLTWTWVRWLGGALLVLLVLINLGVRAHGGDVHALSLGRVSERGLALVLLGLHQLACDDEALRPEPVILAAAQRHRVPSRLALSVARTESSLIHTRISSTGAMGLMQLMPNTARELGVNDPFDVRENAEGGVRYLAQLLAYYRGDARRAVAAYNAGMARVPQRGPGQWPSETRTYVARVLAGL